MCSGRKRKQDWGQMIWLEQPRGLSWCLLRWKYRKEDVLGKYINQDRLGYAVVTNGPPGFTGLTHINLFPTHSTHPLPVGRELFSEYHSGTQKGWGFLLTPFLQPHNGRKGAPWIELWLPKLLLGSEVTSTHILSDKAITELCLTSKGMMGSAILPHAWKSELEILSD